MKIRAKTATFGKLKHPKYWNLSFGPKNVKNRSHPYWDLFFSFFGPISSAHSFGPNLVKNSQAFHSQGTLGAKSYITQNSNWIIISYKSYEKKSNILKCYTVTQLFGLRNFKSYTVTQLHNYIIHWLGKIIGKNICLIFWSVTQLHSKQCPKIKWNEKK